MTGPSSITIICGPTASGKSALAVDLAIRRNGAIINADSLQIYNALPMLTAQPSVADMAQVPHRLYGVLPPTDKCSAQDWRERAAAEIETALGHGHHPIVVGGTGLYIKTLVEGLSAMPDVPADIRADAMALQQRLGNPGFHAELKRVDPVMAARLNPNDTQRLVRAYEVISATGQSLSEFQATPLQGPPEHWRFNIIITTPARETLHEKCDRRFDLMMEGGVLEEVQEQIDLPDEVPVTHALGFRPLRAYLKGDLTKEDAVTQAKAETRQYAKRQDTWFRHQVRAHSSIDEITRVP